MTSMRITDRLRDLTCLGTKTMEKWIESLPSEHRPLDRMVKIVQDRTTLDITDLVASPMSGMTEVSLTELDCVVPPWPYTLVEWEVPPQHAEGEAGMFSGHYRKVMSDDVDRLASLVACLPIETFIYLVRSGKPACDEEEVAGLRYTPEEIRDTLIEEFPLARDFADDDLGRVKFFGWVWTFLHVPGRRTIFGPILENQFLLDGDGKFLTRPIATPDDYGLVRRASLWCEWMYTSDRVLRDSNITQEEYTRSLIYSGSFWMAPTFYAFSLANYQNIRAAPQDPNRNLPRQARRAMARKNEPPLMTYHTLEIGPAGSTNPAKYRPMAEVLREMPLHGVRRHRRTYTDAAPLFGKYVGTFWIRPHMRGNPDVGIATKDYTEGRTTLQRTRPKHRHPSLAGVS